MNSPLPNPPINSSDEPSRDMAKVVYSPPLLVKMDQLAEVTGIRVVTGPV